MSTKKTTIKKNEVPERYLTEGAQVLINGFKTPAKFLSFLTDALHWISIEGVSDEKGADRTFFLRIIITKVLQEWMSNDERINENIAIGLKEIQDCFGYEEYNDEIVIILKGLGVSISKEGCPFKKYLDEYFTGVGIMFQVGECIQAYEYEVNEIRKREAA